MHNIWLSLLMVSVGVGFISLICQTVSILFLLKGSSKKFETAAVFLMFWKFFFGGRWVGGFSVGFFAVVFEDLLGEHLSDLLFHSAGGLSVLAH